jgi:uncharacterized membrane protein YphA (DoxX/SURF4 family)
MTHKALIVLRLFADGRGVAANAVVRLLVGGVFVAEGVQKFLFPEALGVGRFTKIGIPLAQFSAPFVGVVEIVAGTLLVLGLLTRLAAGLLLVDIAVAIATTKVPMLASKGFWPTAHEARTDWSMLSRTRVPARGGGGLALARRTPYTTRDLRELALAFRRVVVTAFGGPAARIAMIEDEFVRRRAWLNPEFLDLVGAAGLIPGPSSTEVAVYIDYRRAGWRGLLVPQSTRCRAAVDA